MQKSGPESPTTSSVRSQTPLGAACAEPVAGGPFALTPEIVFESLLQPASRAMLPVAARTERRRAALESFMGASGFSSRSPMEIHRATRVRELTVDKDELKPGGTVNVAARPTARREAASGDGSGERGSLDRALEQDVLEAAVAGSIQSARHVLVVHGERRLCRCGGGTVQVLPGVVRTRPYSRDVRDRSRSCDEASAGDR